MKFNSVFVFLLLLICSCDSNPYPEGSIKLFPQKAKKEPRPSIAFDVQEGVEFTEGTPGHISLKVSVPGNDPDIQLRNLPFVSNKKNEMYLDNSDPENLKIRWTPDYSAADDLKHPRRNWRRYVITVELSSRSRPEIFTKFDIDFHVIDKRRDFRIVGSGSIVLKEGESLNEIYTVINKDFPNTLHDFDFTRDFKSHTHIIKYFSLIPGQEDITKFHLVSDALPYDFLRHNDGDLLKKLFPFHYQNKNSHIKPDPIYTCNSRYDSFKGCRITGAILIKATDHTDTSAYYSIDFDVRDTRMDSLISMPQIVSKGRNINFTITAVDNNREYKPRIYLQRPQKAVFGNLRCYNLDSQGRRERPDEESLDNDSACSNLSNSSMVPVESDISSDKTFERRVDVAWTEIPESLLAEDVSPQELIFKICTLGEARRIFNNCLERTVSFGAEFVPPPGPVFTWNEEEKTIYTRRNSPVTIPFSIREFDNRDQKSYLTNIQAKLTKVDYKGETTTSSVLAYWDREEEIIKFQAPNMQGSSTIEFTVTAKSRYQIESSTTFSLDIETISETLFIQTEDLQTADGEVSNRRLDNIAKVVHKIVIDTPHLDRLPPGIKESLKDLGIKYEKNVLEGRDMSLRKFSLVSNSVLPNVKGNIFFSDLEENESAPVMVYHDESFNPSPNVACKQIFFIDKRPEDPINKINQMITSIPLAVKCNKKEEEGTGTNRKITQKVYVVMGFDYDKIKSDLTMDETVIKGWKQRQLHSLSF